MKLAVATTDRPGRPSLARIKAIIQTNREAGKEPYAGLESSEIGEYNRALMWGEHDEAYPGDEAWSRIVD
jgi:hypothetical protein